MTDLMATTDNRPPSPDVSPTLAIGAYPELSRCVSTASSLSHCSSTDAASRDSLGSDLTSRQSSSSYNSRHSDASSHSRQSVQSAESKSSKAGRRRGYMRPHGTDFAASARSRESVMSLGSIAHLQYYFARTGLLDGKGAQLARKKQARNALELASLDPSAISTSPPDGADSSYTFMGSDSPELAQDGFEPRDSAPRATNDDEDEEYFEDSFTSDPGMLPPTVSTYHHKEKPLPKPPAIVELKSDLVSCLTEAVKALREAEARKAGTYQESPSDIQLVNMPEENSQGWYQLQGMHILDVVTLAIRAAKMYYTAHEMPDRLDSIKPEKQIRADLLAVMEVLKQMAFRGFKGGMKDDDISTMLSWTDSVFAILRTEQEIESAERSEQANWTWLHGDWTGRELERERAFLMSMDTEAEPLPAWTPTSSTTELPTAFLSSMQNGVRLIQLHNAVVKKSRRRFGAIPEFHSDTQKPYRCAENLRYWIKAAELRFEVNLSVDVMGVVHGSGPEAWLGFEAAILKWCQRVRHEVTAELQK